MYAIPASIAAAALCTDAGIPTVWSLMMPWTSIRCNPGPVLGPEHDAGLLDGGGSRLWHQPHPAIGGERHAIELKVASTALVADRVERVARLGPRLEPQIDVVGDLALVATAFLEEAFGPDAALPW